MAGVDAIASVMGIASFGITLLDGIKKAKEFWDDVKEAPDDMKYALKELEALKLVLEDIRKNDTNQAPIAPTAASQCLKLCRDGVEVLEKLVQDLNSVVEKRRRFGSAKVVLKKETIKKLQDRLSSAQRILLLCRQTFAEAQQASHHTIQIDTFKASALDMQVLLQQEMQRGFQELKAVVAQSTIQVAPFHASTVIGARKTHVQAPDDYEGAIVRRGSRPRRKNEKLYFRSKLRMPLWFSRTSRTWDFAVHEIPSGWKHVFRQYYTIDWVSPVLGCVYFGKVEGLRELFASKRATPFDRTCLGFTLLDIAAQRADETMCSLLLEEGADVNDSYLRSSIYLACGPPVDDHCVHRGKRNNILRQLLSVSDDFSLDFEWPFQGDIDDVLFLLRLTCAYWKCLPLEEVVTFVLEERIDYKQDCIGTVEDILELILGEEELDERVTEMTGAYGYNLLRKSALSLVFSVCRKLPATAPPEQFSQIISSKLGKSNFEAGGSLFCPRISAEMECVLRLITSGSNIHNEIFSKLGQKQSILITIILDTFRHFCSGCSCCILSALPLAARLWLEVLHEAGVDLVQYGKEELHLLLTHYIDPRLRPASEIEWTILSFNYGPTPEDWEFRLVHYYWYWEYHRYQAVQQFWDMAENPERNIPGAWEATFDDALYSLESRGLEGFDLHDLGECQGCGDYCRFRSPKS